MKRDPELSRIVSAHPFLAGVKPSLQGVFCQCAALQTFAQKQLIFGEGGAADHFYLIHSGQVLLEVFAPGRGTITIQALGSGDALGWSWLFPPHLWHFSATAVNRTQLISFPAEALRAKAKQSHEFCYELVVRLAQVLAGRLEDVRTRLIHGYD